MWLKTARGSCAYVVENKVYVPYVPYVPMCFKKATYLPSGRFL